MENTYPCNTREHGAINKQRILIAACDMAAEMGIDNIRRDAVAKHAGFSIGAVTTHFGNMDGLRQAIMQHAIKTERLDIIAMGLANSDPIAIKAPKELKIRALRTLM